MSGQSLHGIPGGVVVRVQHASLQDKTKFDPATQLTGGYGATFAITLARATQAKTLPHRLKYWIVSFWMFGPSLRVVLTKAIQSATSLGGVESLVEYRLRSDPGADPRLLRLSVGVEDLEDLKNDLKQGFTSVANIGKYIVSSPVIESCVSEDTDMSKWNSRVMRRTVLRSLSVKCNLCECHYESHEL